MKRKTTINTTSSILLVLISLSHSSNSLKQYSKQTEGCLVLKLAILIVLTLPIPITLSLIAFLTYDTLIAPFDAELHVFTITLFCFISSLLEFYCIPTWPFFIHPCYSISIPSLPTSSGFVSHRDCVEDNPCKFFCALNTVWFLH